MPIFKISYLPSFEGITIKSVDAHGWVFVVLGRRNTETASGTTIDGEVGINGLYFLALPPR
jgi:hypothetical protein